MPYTATFTVPLPEVHSLDKALATASVIATAVKNSTVNQQMTVKDVSIKSTKGPR